MRSHLALSALCVLAACDTAPAGPGQEADPFDGVISGVANGVAFSDSVQVRYLPEFERVDVDAPLPAVPGVSCGGLTVTFFLDPEPGVQDLRHNGGGPGNRGLLVSDAAGDAVCDVLLPTSDEGNQIVLTAGDRPGELVGAFRFVAVGEREDLGLDTLRVDNGRIVFSIGAER